MKFTPFFLITIVYPLNFQPLHHRPHLHPHPLFSKKHLPVPWFPSTNFTQDAQILRSHLLSLRTPPPPSSQTAPQLRQSLIDFNVTVPPGTKKAGLLSMLRNCLDEAGVDDSFEAMAKDTIPFGIDKDGVSGPRLLEDTFVDLSSSSVASSPSFSPSPPSKSKSISKILFLPFFLLFTSFLHKNRSSPSFSSSITLTSSTTFLLSYLLTLLLHLRSSFSNSKNMNPIPPSQTLSKTYLNRLTNPLPKVLSLPISAVLPAFIYLTTPPFVPYNRRTAAVITLGRAGLHFGIFGYPQLLDSCNTSNTSTHKSTFINFLSSTRAFLTLASLDVLSLLYLAPAHNFYKEKKTMAMSIAKAARWGTALVCVGPLWSFGFGLQGLRLRLRHGGGKNEKKERKCLPMGHEVNKFFVWLLANEEEFATWKNVAETKIYQDEWAQHGLEFGDGKADALLEEIERTREDPFFETRSRAEDWPMESAMLKGKVSMRELANNSELKFSFQSTKVT